MSNCNKNQAMPVALGPLLGAGLGALQQGKIDKALAGQKTYSKPKTIFGKIIGGVSGRTAAAEASEAAKSSPISSSVANALQPRERMGTPISGGISFGGESVKRSYLPFYLAAVVAAIFFFMRKKGGRRRR
jgi:hypothetical protein